MKYFENSFVEKSISWQIFPHKKRQRRFGKK